MPILPEAVTFSSPPFEYELNHETGKRGNPAGPGQGSAPLLNQTRCINFTESIRQAQTKIAHQLNPEKARQHHRPDSKQEQTGKSTTEKAKEGFLPARWRQRT